MPSNVDLLRWGVYRKVVCFYTSLARWQLEELDTMEFE